MGRAEVRATKRAADRAVRNLRAQGAVDLKNAPVKVPAISLGYCWNENHGVSGFWHQSILRLLQGLAGRVGFRPVGVESGPFLSRARNLIVDRFLAGTDEYLLFTDTDMVFGAEDVELLLEADAPIAGALYFNAATGMTPWSTALVEVKAPEGYSGPEHIPPGTYGPLVLPELPDPPSAPPDGEEIEEAAAKMAAWTALAAEYDKPREVAAVGMGLTLIKREVVAAVRSIYARPFEFIDDQGEDLVFCLRAAEMGYKTFVVPGARIGHSKVTIL